MHFGEMILSKICDSNDPKAITRLGLSKEHFPTNVEKEVFDFILDYSEKNRGQAPDYRTLVGANPDFYYYENVSDSFEYLVGELKNYSARIQVKDLLSKEAVPRFNASDREGIEFAKWTAEQLLEIVKKTETRSKIGINMKDDTDMFLKEYQRRKNGESFKVWKSAFSTINNQISGYFSSNLYVWYGRSGRGKSVFTLREGIEAAFQGANVLLWAMEMSWFEVMVRLYSMVSAKLGIAIANIDGVDMEAGFSTKELSMGKLSEEFEKGFEDFLANINNIIPGNIIIRAVDHEDFYVRDIKELEKDIEETQADFVIVDPFYYMSYAKNTSKKTGGDAEETSKKLRALAGRTQTVIMAITQADEGKEKKNEEEKRQIDIPDRASVKKTKALLEDCANLFSIDTADGLGAIEINKGRNGGENTRVEVIYLPSYGIVREPTIAEVKENQFNETF